MRDFYHTKFYLLALLLACPLLAAASEPLRVFILHAYSQEYPWTKSQHQGFIHTYQAHSYLPALISTEYLDTKRRHYDADYARWFATYLREKYHQYRPDVIYVSDDNALDFARHYLPDNFADAPVFFSGINDYSLLTILDKNHFCGVFEKKEIAPNLELLKRMDVGMRRIMVVGDASSTYQVIETELRQQLQQYPDIQAGFIADSHLDTIIAALRQHGGRYLFLATIGGISDKEGRALSLGEVIAAIVATGDYIIISMEDAYLREGVLGGYVTNGQRQGEAAARLLLNWQEGNALADIPMLTHSPNVYMFDYLQLNRHQLSLPPDIAKQANLINKPSSWYAQNRTLILSALWGLGLGIFALMAWFLWILSRKNREIQRSSTQLAATEALERERMQRVERYQEALFEWSRVNYKNLDEAFSRATEISAKTLNIHYVSIWLYDDPKTYIVRQNQYVLGSGHQPSITLYRTDFPIYFDALDSGKVLVVNDARNDPRTREFNGGYLQANNIYAMLDIPILYQGYVVGVVCHEHIGAPRQWAIDEQEFATAIARTVSLSLEIAKRRETEQQLAHQAYHDALTDLPNRSLFMDRLEHAIFQAQQSKTLVAVLFLDLDNFKQINDSMGHSVGDQVLMTIANLLRDNFREVDTIARLGGDEFTMILPHFADTRDINEMTIKLFKAMQQSVHIENQEIYITSSIGVSIYPNDGETPETLLRNADAAMYRAKEEGRNSFQFYTQDLTERAFERVLMESNLRRAIDKEEFTVYYQPQFDTISHQLIGLEALVRWNHPELGLVSPGKFIPIAEETGLIVPIDRWVMRHAIEQSATWLRHGLNPGRLFLNLAMRQLDDSEFLPTLLVTLARF